MNWNLLGHEWAVNLLKEHVLRNEARHAYLFCGPRGVGRRTLALRLAQALNCEEPLAPGEPCGTCRNCTQMNHMQHPDLALLQAEQEGGTLKVEQVRQLQHTLSLHSFQARYRVALLLRFEEAHPSAMNALLKTLEEPAPQVVLMLTALSAENLLPTIVSRCEVLRLRPLPFAQVEQGLQKLWQVPAEQAHLLAHISGGRPGLAYQLFSDPQRLEQRRACLAEHTALLAARRVERFRLAEGYARDKEALRNVLLTWLSLWRDVLLHAGGAATPLVNHDQQMEIERLTLRFGLPAAQRTIAALERALLLLEQNVNPRLVTEVLMLDLPFA